MSKETVEKSTKKHKKSDGREENPPKAKKGRRSAATSDDLGKDQRPLGDSSTANLESVGDSTLTLRAKDKLSEVSPDVSSNTIGKVKVSKKRKQTDRDAKLGDQSEANTTEPKPRRRKKCHEHGAKDLVHSMPLSDPAVDESLSEQSRKALSYAFEQCRGNEAWKFNKARQNWLLRNVWSEQAVPEKYIPLAIKYLADIKGGARKKLIEECTSKMSAPEQTAQPSDQTTNDESAIQQHPSALRASSLFHALQKDN